MARSEEAESRFTIRSPRARSRLAASGMTRVGFERRVAEVCLGKVGAVAAREVSRFARNSREWQQLIEMCRVVDTVLIDQELVYAPRPANDHLLLGLKGSLRLLPRSRTHLAKGTARCSGNWPTRSISAAGSAIDPTNPRSPEPWPTPLSHRLIPCRGPFSTTLLSGVELGKSVLSLRQRLPL